MNKKVYRLRFCLATLLLAVCASLAGAAPARAQNAAGWARVGGVDESVTLEDVFMVGPELAWAAGRSNDDRTGYIYRLALVGGRWQVTTELTTAFGLYAVAATSAEDVWAVGANGYIVRRIGGSWSNEPLNLSDVTFVDIQVLGRGEEAWVAGARRAAEGSRPFVMRLRDGVWREVPVELPDNSQQVIQSIHLANGGGWAVGSLIWRITDAGLRVETMPNLCGGGFGCLNSFSSVRAIDADRAWAAGGRSATCGVCTEKIGIGYRERGEWRDAFGPAGWTAVLPDVQALPDTHSLGALFFTDANNGMAVGSRVYGQGMGRSEIFALRYVNGGWQYQQVLPDARNTVKELFLADANRGLLVGTGGLIVSYGYGAQNAPAANPATRVANPNQLGVVYFSETGHTLRGRFLDYWQRYGGLEQFGYPVTEEYTTPIGNEGGTVVQYFERARFEYHPENAGTRYEVLLGLLGNEVAQVRRGEPAFVYNPNPTNQPGSVYFPETGHTMAAEFVSYWNRYGGLPIYGYPISEPFYEVNQADGRTYLVQYFERNRFEHHPENAGSRYEVLLGLLGNEIVRSRGWTR